MGDRYSFVPATREQMEAVRRRLGTNEEDIARSVAALRHWLSQQPHLPDQIDDGHIERMYINCKCSMERTKKSLDGYFSLRTRFPEMLTSRDPAGPDVAQTMEHVKMVMMPRLTSELCRVHIVTDIDPDPQWVSWPNYGKVTSIGAEMMLFDDYSLGDLIVFDMKNVNMGHVARVDINAIRAMEYIAKTAYCRRLIEFHLVNADKMTDFVVKVLKSVFSEKLQNRIHVHLPGSTTLFDHVAKEDLPDELGGTAGPVEKLAYEFIRRAEKKHDWFLEQDRYTSDESRRPRDNHYADDLYGAEGSFKKLSVD